MKKLTIVYFYIFTDGDFAFNSDFLNNYTSRYFDQDFYEFTKIEGYTYSARRVFEDSESAVEFVNKIKDNCTDPIGENYYIDEVIPEFFNDILQTYLKYDCGSDSYDGNVELSLSIEDVETDVKKIKCIEYLEE